MAKRKSKKQSKWIYVLIVFIGIASIFLMVDFFINLNVDISDKIAVIPIHGTITMGGSSFLGGEVASSEDIVELIKKADEDVSVKAIILDINSPGGAVVASEEIAMAVKDVDKPVVSLIREVGASGGYWVASAGNIIVASPMSITGSIGVLSSYLQISDLMENYGIEYERLVAGQYKDAGSPFKELTSAERNIIQNKLNKIHRYFIEQVAMNRNMEYEEVEELATGIYYLGIEAVDIGLVDELGGKDEAIEIAEQASGIEDADIIILERKRTVFDVFNGISAEVSYYIGKGMGNAFTDFNANPKV